MKRHIRVVFANCPSLDVGACSYLVLAQNAVQDVFEFEVCHPSVFADKSLSLPSTFRGQLVAGWAECERPLPFRRFVSRQRTAWLDRQVFPPLRGSLNPEESHKMLMPFIAKHNEWMIRAAERGYGSMRVGAVPTVMVTEASLGTNYFGWSEGSEFAIISVRNWRRRHRPPSVIEYVLAQVQRYAIRIAVCPESESHHATRACLWDFDPNVTDARMALLVGYLCEECEDRLKKHMSGRDVEKVRELLSHRWIGKVEEPGSVASNLRRVFHYDLTRTRGMAPSVIDQMRTVGVSELLKLIVAGGVGMLSLKSFQLLKATIASGSAWWKLW